MPSAFERYRDRLNLCLVTYQFIEQGLRFCLHRCHAIVRFRLDGYLPYEAPFQAIEDAALGRLVDWYKSYTNNTELVRELRAIKSVRDHIAHQGFALTLEEQTNESFLLQKATELEEAHARAQKCFESIMGEMKITDEAVSRAYQNLRSMYIASNQEPPQPFDDNALHP